MWPENNLSTPSQLAPFQQQQLAFTAHIRDPENQPIPESIPAQRMAVYAELIYNGMHERLSMNFPVLSEVLGDQRWRTLVRDFLVRHKAQTPLFTEIAHEFLEHLQNTLETLAEDPPFMLELAHYEYVELAVALSDADENASAEQIDPNGDLLTGQPVLAATAWNLRYAYPVHRISLDYQPQQPEAQATDLVVYRDRQDQVHFLEINAVTQRLLALLKESSTATGLEVLKQIANELQHPQPEAVIQAGTDLLHDLHERNVILGTRRV